MEVVCQCGAVKFNLPDSKPLALYHCHCLECQRQSASAFGTSIIYPAEGIMPLSPEIEAKVKIWTRPALEGRTMDCYFCSCCGVRLLHQLRAPDGTPRPTVSIKSGLLHKLEWAKAVHIYTKTAVVPIPEGAEQYEEQDLSRDL